MKAGYYIIIGLIFWFVLSFINSLWVFQSKGHIGAAIIVGLSNIVWLTSRENRERLRPLFHQKVLTKISRRDY